MIHSFQDYEEWRLIALRELVYILYSLETFETLEALCDRLDHTLRLLEGATITPDPDPLAEFFGEDPEELKQFRAGVLPND